MAGRNKSKRPRQQPQSGKQSAQQRRPSTSSTTGSNFPSSGRQYTLSVDPGSPARTFVFSEQEPNEEQAAHFSTPLIEKVGTRPSPEDDGIQLDYVDDDPLVYTEDDEDWIDEDEDPSDYDTEPTFGSRYITDAAENTRSPEYIQSFQQHDPMTTYNPEISLRNYALAAHYLDQIQMTLNQLDSVVSAEQDGTLQGLMLAMGCIAQQTRDGVMGALEIFQQEITEAKHVRPA